MSQPINPKLTALARTFVALHDARHKADYDTAAAFSRTEVMSKIAEVEQALTDLKAIRNDSNARVFLVALLFQEIWKRR